MSTAVKYITVGDGVTTEFPFGFVINASGGVVVYVNGILQEGGYAVAFNLVGGTITFTTPPTSGHQIVYVYFDQLTSNTQFAGATRVDRGSLDGEISKLYRGMRMLDERIQRCLQFPEPFDSLDFATNLPAALIGNVSRVLIIDAAGTAIEAGPTTTEIANAQAYAVAAIAARDAALVAQAAAEASETAAAASAVTALAAAAVAVAAAATASASAPPAVLTAITDGLAAATITDGVNPYDFTPGAGVGQTNWVSVEFSIYRGTTVVGTGYVQLIHNGTIWQFVERSYDSIEGKSLEHGLTFSMSGNELQVAADTGAGTGKLYTRAFQA